MIKNGLKNIFYQGYEPKKEPTPWTVVRPEWRVSRDRDALAAAELDEPRLRQIRVRLDLVHDRLDFGYFQHALDLHRVEVADADGLDQAVIHQLLHGTPRVNVVDIREDPLVLVVLREQVLAIAEVGIAHGPVDEVQVEVVDLEELQRFLDGTADVFWVVKDVPQLRRDEQILALDDALGYFCCDCVADLVLVSVNKGAVDVTIAGVDGVLDGLLDLTRW
jgi:hypothetical protein